MPVRSLRSSVLKWPDANAVVAALRAWIADLAIANPEVCRVGYFGSYARGDWGVGSDLDVVVILEQSELPFERRAAGWDTSVLPVAADVLAYTNAEWRAMQRSGHFPARFVSETIWLYEREPGCERLTE